MTTVSTENSEHYKWGDGCEGWHLVKTYSLSIIRERVPKGGEEVRHYHERSEQFFYVLEGVASIEVDGIDHEVKSLQGIHVASGLTHQLRNNHDDDLVFIVTSTPTSHGDRVETS